MIVKNKIKDYLVTVLQDGREYFGLVKLSCVSLVQLNDTTIQADMVKITFDEKILGVSEIEE